MTQDDSSQQTAIQQAVQLLTQARHIVCLTGAGVSAESGIRTFRDAAGLWNEVEVQQVASPEGFAADPGRVWQWYMARLDTVDQAEPNPGHLALAELDKQLRARALHSFTLVTQNVDDLHERAGSRPVLHLHGSLAEFRCHACGAPYTLAQGDRTSTEPPRCPACDGLIRPGVVWFGEWLPEDVFAAANQAAAGCDLCLVVGTSGVVYPAAQIPTIAWEAGAAVIDINPEPTPFSRQANVYLQGPSGAVLPRLAAAIAP